MTKVIVTTAAASAMTGATVTLDSVAPTIAPPHLARVTLKRSFTRLPVPPDSRLSNPMPTIVVVNTVVLSS